MNQPKSNRTERAGSSRTAIDDNRIDDILAGEEELMPSSGFVSSVMERVRQEAAVPAPTPFPWMKAILFILPASGVCGWGAVSLIRFSLPTLNTLSLTPLTLPAALVAPAEQAGWVVMALGVSLLSWLLARRLAGRGGLL